MTTAQELQMKVAEAKKELEERLVAKLKPMLPNIKIEASVDLNLDAIQLRFLEESKENTAVSITKTFFERIVEEESVKRNIGSYSNTLMIDANGQIIGSYTKTSVYSYELISTVFQVIEQFHKEETTVEKPEEVEETKEQAS